MNNEEEWTTIKEYPKYFVSTHGNIENSLTGKLLKPFLDNGGYYYVVNLCKNGKKKTMMIHQLVARAFLDNPENKRCVDHKNNIKLDNNVTNLRWVTNSENNMNCSIRKTNTSGCKGVHFDKSKNKWRAQIMTNRKHIYLGCFNTFEEAKLARQNKATELFGQFKNACEC